MYDKLIFYFPKKIENIKYLIYLSIFIYYLGIKYIFTFNKMVDIPPIRSWADIVKDNTHRPTTPPPYRTPPVCPDAPRRKRRPSVMDFSTISGNTFETPFIKVICKIETSETEGSEDCLAFDDYITLKISLVLTKCTFGEAINKMKEEMAKYPKLPKIADGKYKCTSKGIWFKIFFCGRDISFEIRPKMDPDNVGTLMVESRDIETILF